MNKILFTTSWDDGSVLDLKVEKILSKFGVKGTFYIPEKFDGDRHGGKFSAYGRRLRDAEILEISTRQEVGGHSLTHRKLTDLTPEEIKKEIFGSKTFLENIIGSSIKVFAPPGGQYNDEIIAQAKAAGFEAIRTTQKLNFHIARQSTSLFLLGVSTICQPFPFRKKDALHFNWMDLLSPMSAYKPMQFATSWLALAKKLFDRAVREGNYFHLYGHSWELEKYGMWQELEDFLQYIKSRDDVIFLTNGELLKIDPRS